MQPMRQILLSQLRWTAGAWEPQRRPATESARCWATDCGESNWEGVRANRLTWSAGREASLSLILMSSGRALGGNGGLAVMASRSRTPCAMCSPLLLRPERYLHCMKI